MQMQGSEFTPQFLILGVIWYIVFLFSTTCHVGAHSLVAKIGGDTTAFHGGQVTLNPIPHLQPVLTASIDRLKSVMSVVSTAPSIVVQDGFQYVASS